MKKAIIFLLLCVLCACPVLGEGPVTVAEWINAEGQCGDCTLTVTVGDIYNPVWAGVSDESGSVNLFGIWRGEVFYLFGENGFQTGDTIVLSNPVYNVFEGNVEMTQAQLSDIIVPDMGFTRLSVREWLDAKGETGNCVVIAQVQQVLNPVLAVIADTTGEVNLFGVVIDGEMHDFFSLGIGDGDLLILVNPRYNLFEDSVEMADSMLFRLISHMENDGSAE